MPKIIGVYDPWSWSFKHEDFTYILTYTQKTHSGIKYNKAKDIIKMIHDLNTDELIEFDRYSLSQFNIPPIEKADFNPQQNLMDNKLSWRVCIDSHINIIYTYDFDQFELSYVIE